MLQNQNPVRRWKQWLVLPALSGVFLCASKVVSAQSGTSPVEAKLTINSEEVQRKLHEALHQDSLRTGGKFEPGTRQFFNIENMDKPGKVSVTVTRVKNWQVPPISNGETVYTYVEQMPALPAGGGMGAIVAQIQDNFVYPSGPHQEGRVFASFIVGATGQVHDARIIKGLAPAYDAAVIAAIEKLPRFVPGKQSGRDVAVSFTVPMLFKEKP